MNARPNPRALVVALVLGLYGLACATPALRGHGRTIPGLLLLFGGRAAPRCWAPWSANLLLGVGLLALACRRYRTAAALGWTAAGLALTAWAVPDQGYLIGYYFWQASPILLLLGARVLGRQDAAPGRRT